MFRVLVWTASQKADQITAARAVSRPSVLWTPTLPIGPSALTVRQFQLAPGSTTAARTCAASAAGTVRVMREPETLTGI